MQPRPKVRETPQRTSSISLTSTSFMRRRASHRQPASCSIGSGQILPRPSMARRRATTTVMLTTPLKSRKGRSTRQRTNTMCRIQTVLTTKSTMPTSIRGMQRERRLPVERGSTSTHPLFFWGGVCHQCGRFIRRQTILLHRPPATGGWAMINVRVSKPLAKAIVDRREIQRHLECLTRQITARGGRQTTTVKALSRARRRSGRRTCHQELVDRLTFERWVELDMIRRRLAMQESVIGELQHRDERPLHCPAT